VKVNLKGIAFASFAVIPGIIVLLGYFLEIPVLLELRTMFLQWAVILTAVALLVGVVNLVSVHWRKISKEETGWVYSITLVISLVITVLVLGITGPTSAWSLWIFNNIQIPIESSLMAILAVVLVLAVARMFSRRLNIFTIIFVLTIFVVLIGSITIPFINIPGLREIRAWVMQVWAMAGARGILLGVALGTIATGLRVIMGADRPYSG
jgi:hypothetical protein